MPKLKFKYKFNCRSCVILIIHESISIFYKNGGQISAPRDTPAVAAFISYRLKLVYRLSIEWWREPVVKEYQKLCTRTLCSHVASHPAKHRRKDTAVHFTLRLKIYCTPTSFSEFMTCKVEAPRSMWPDRVARRMAFSPRSCWIRKENSAKKKG